MSRADITYLAPSPGLPPVARGFYVTAPRSDRPPAGPFPRARQAEAALAAMERAP